MLKGGNPKLNSAFSKTLRGFTLVLVGVIAATLKLVLLLMEHGANAVQLHATTIIATTIALTLAILIYAIALLRHLRNFQKLALTDQLTGIPNRTALAELCDSSRFRSALENGSVALVSLDMDGFKQINDDYGHCVGDLALQKTAARITGLLRQSDKVFRIGGDEFLCVVYDPEPRTAAAKVVERLGYAFRGPMHLNGKETMINISVGISVASKGEPWEAIFNRSDAEMYRDKHAKRALKPSAPRVSLLEVAT